MPYNQPGGTYNGGYGSGYNNNEWDGWDGGSLGMGDHGQLGGDLGSTPGGNLGSGDHGNLGPSTGYNGGTGGGSLMGGGSAPSFEGNQMGGNFGGFDGGFGGGISDPSGGNLMGGGGNNGLMGGAGPVGLGSPQGIGPSMGPGAGLSSPMGVNPAGAGTPYGPGAPSAPDSGLSSLNVAKLSTHGLNAALSKYRDPNMGTQYATDALNATLGTNYNPRQVGEMARTTYGEAANQTPEGMAAAANSMVNRLGLGALDPNKYGYLGGGNPDSMLRGYDANGYDASRVGPANVAYRDAVPGTQGYNEGLQALSDALNPGSKFSTTAPPTVKNATHYYNPRTASPSWGGPNMMDYGDHRFGNPEPTAGAVADLRVNPASSGGPDIGGLPGMGQGTQVAGPYSPSSAPSAPSLGNISGPSQQPSLGYGAPDGLGVNYTPPAPRSSVLDTLKNLDVPSYQSNITAKSDMLPTAPTQQQQWKPSKESTDAIRMQQKLDDYFKANPPENFRPTPSVTPPPGNAYAGASPSQVPAGISGGEGGNTLLGGSGFDTLRSGDNSGGSGQWNKNNLSGGKNPKPTDKNKDKTPKPKPKKKRGNRVYYPTYTQNWADLPRGLMGRFNGRVL